MLPNSSTNIPIQAFQFNIPERIRNTKGGLQKKKRNEILTKMATVGSLH